MKMYNPPHPGRALKACFDDTFTVEEAASKMGISVNTLLDIMEEKAPITNEIAFLLSHAMPNSNPAVWIRAQANYDAWQTTHNRKWQNRILKAHRIIPEISTKPLKADPETAGA